jgi:urease accessory protein UreF
MRLLWDVKPLTVSILEEVVLSDFDTSPAVCFAPLLEIGSMRHVSLSTRLFIS